MHAHNNITEYSIEQYAQFLEELMNTYGNELTFLAYSYLKNIEDSKDIVQNVFVSAYQNIERLQSKEYVKTWLFRVTINKCKDHLKSSFVKRIVLLGTNPESEEKAASLDKEMMEKEIAYSIRKAVFKLRVRYREVIMMKFFQDLSIKEIAEILNLPEATVHTRLRRAKEQLGPILEQEVFTNE
ncbi:MULTISPECIES: RNA polymerase sigma factor [Cytobacillus]|uniref:RNA polymerase sigma-70 factor (ECF subfamily) n=1 Tax=Cytobacillus oceanisediminis TaxID=665099 RepID=A0ABX3CXN9_9BACI|nr:MULTISPECIES: sigma-70 family RNA polymerase sigma factor [Cytobacillus]OHX49900.1 hypothetical protein BBV17_10370 [Cytobacillus oceanisediminis]QOK25854.1 sigma-70 family RNA polymerase sigma factor [Cytobacillus oceanisediminis]